MGTTLLTEIENEIAAAEAQVKTWWNAAENATKNLAALVFADLKQAATAAGAALKVPGVAAIATITSWLQSEAQVVVGLTEQAFSSYLTGPTKFSVALASLWTSITSKVIPGLVDLGKTTLSSLFSMSTLTTVLQAAFAALSVGGVI